MSLIEDENDGLRIATGTSSGARVYDLVATTWVLRGTVDGGAASVFLSDAGRILAVGGNETSRVLDVSGTAFLQLGGDVEGTILGTSDDGATVVSVGDGVVRVFSFDGAAWSQVGGDVASGNRSTSAAMSGDGLVVAVGTHTDLAGRARVYSWDGIAWDQAGSDITSSAPGDKTGYALALDFDGSVLAVSAPLSNGAGGSMSGVVRTFAFVDGEYAQQGPAIAGEAFDQAGTSLSLTYDGSLVALGAPGGLLGGAGEARAYSLASCAA